ncbi:hypothetical protein [Marinimicrobium sp. C2-29]|uniref:hypothetical protein n=1 Tax=Marinimicrobium sp. C2-29 TaxID=3139825 RepID=UPI0031393AC4
MTSIRSKLSIAFLLVATAIAGCNADSDADSQDAEVPSDYSHYRKGDISVAYPSTWTFFFDDRASLYADREVNFKVSDFSTARILILNEHQRSTESVVDHFVDEFQIKSDSLLINYERSSTTIAGFSGERITWSDTLAGQSDFEFTVIKVQDEPYDTFVTFNLSDEDIPKNEVHKAHFVQSIQLD